MSSEINPPNLPLPKSGDICSPFVKGDSGGFSVLSLSHGTFLKGLTWHNKIDSAGILGYNKTAKKLFRTFNFQLFVAPSQIFDETSVLLVCRSGYSADLDGKSRQA